MNSRQFPTDAQLEALARADEETTIDDGCVVTECDVDHRMFQSLERRRMVSQMRPAVRVGQHKQYYWQITPLGRRVLEQQRYELTPAARAIDWRNIED